jgi:hypothetical protein
VKVGTPLGEYPFLFRRIERRAGGLAIVGTIAGLESSLVLSREDLAGATRKLALPVAAVALLAYSRRHR